MRRMFFFFDKIVKNQLLLPIFNEKLATQSSSASQKLFNAFNKFMNLFFLLLPILLSFHISKLQWN